MTKLFKFHGFDSGEWLQNNIKISIADVRAATSLANPYGTFTVQIRRASDSDNVPVILEQFTECDLNPASSNFVAAKIGDMFMEFDYSTNRLREYGQYRNQSKYIRIEMNPSVENGTADPELLPFGVFGPIRPTSIQIKNNVGNQDKAVATNTQIHNASYGGFGSSFLGLISDIGNHIDKDGPTQLIHADVGATTVAQFTASYEFPRTLFRISASDGTLGDPKEAYFGLQTGKTHTDVTFDPGYPDYLRRLPAGYTQVDTIAGAGGPSRAYSWTFSLDDVSTRHGGVGFFQSGSRRGGDSRNSYEWNLQGRFLMRVTTDSLRLYTVVLTDSTSMRRSHLEILAISARLTHSSHNYAFNYS
jgi:hypothetical protein